MNEIPTYFARVVEEISTEWGHLRVGVFRQADGVEEQVGEYERNYRSLLSTFAHFRADGRDLALYSPDYTCTRLMELPSCRDIGGEEPSAGGFCPVDYFVPYYIELESRVDNGPPRRYRKQMPTPEDRIAKTVPFTWPPGSARPGRVEQHHTAPVGPITYHPFGFVAGCIWGDDSSWKLQYLDLSRAAEGILRREERFGYLELPDRPLERAIDLIDFQSDPDEDYAYHVRITRTDRFDLRDGRWIDPLA